MRRPSILPRIVLAASVLGIVAAGCGRSGSKVATTPAHGRVLYKGQPLPRALVVFVPDEPLRAPDGTEVPFPSGTTGDDGSYVVHTYEPDDGLPPGSYRVKVSTAPAPSADNDMLRPRIRAELADVLKDRYLDPTRSGLTATIRPGPNEIPTFDLK